MSGMKLSEELEWRGFVNQTTFDDLKKLDKKSWTFYHGFDASADSQTVGNLAAMMLDRAFLRHGHKAILLAGGATSLIGDPGGKDKERPLQDEQTVEHNVRCAEEQLNRVFRGYEFKLVNNLDWFRSMNVLHFLRDVGKHFSMTALVQRDYIATRMGESGAGISYTEFSYTLLQGYDFLHLHKQYGVDLQLAGSDQWGNSLSGVDLIRRAEGAEVHVLTLPLVINKATGRKFGKSEGGAVWLDPERTSPTQFYQFWVNSDDGGVEGYLKIFTELTKDDITEIMTEHNKDPRKRVAQLHLAQEVTKLVHGEKEMKAAEEVTAYITGKKPIGEASSQEILLIQRELAYTSVRDGADILDVLVATGLANSKADARRLLAGNAVSVNNDRFVGQTLTISAFQNGRLLLRKGKTFKDSVLVTLTK